MRLGVLLAACVALAGCATGGTGGDGGTGSEPTGGAAAGSHDAAGGKPGDGHPNGAGDRASGAPANGTAHGVDGTTSEVRWHLWVGIQCRPTPWAQWGWAQGRSAPAPAAFSYVNATEMADLMADYYASQGVELVHWGVHRDGAAGRGAACDTPDGHLYWVASDDPVFDGWDGPEWWVLRESQCDDHPWWTWAEETGHPAQRGGRHTERWEEHNGTSALLLDFYAARGVDLRDAFVSRIDDGSMMTVCSAASGWVDWVQASATWEDGSGPTGWQPTVRPLGL